MPATLVLELASSATPDVRALIEELDRELAQHYAAAQRHGLTLDAIFQPGVRFFIARVDGRAVGCGGIALRPGFAEIKRMYVQPGSRGRGVADAILARLATEALESGRSLLRLETGTHQAAAIRFYQRSGFSPCEAFEPYSSMPPHAIATSLFLEKRLNTT
jgi:putative acetyltransferase